MTLPEVLTKAPVWLSLAGYAFGAATYSLSAGHRMWDAVARSSWTVACAGMLVHIGSAFLFFDRWSIDVAYRETARQTAEVFGVNWGGGVYLNFFLAAAWVVDVIWWWRGLDSYRRRSKAVEVGWNVFLFVMFFNATVVFASGVVRIVGLCVCAILCILWVIAFSRSTRSEEIRASADS